MTGTERQFAALYAGMSELELLAVARDYDSLQEAAQVALRAEFAVRGLEPPLANDDGDTEVWASRRLVTVSRFRDLSEAIVARSMLESAGIIVSLRDENLVRLDWQISNFIGGLRLQVDAGDEAAARELLAQPVFDDISYGGEAEYRQPHCPVCGSMEIMFEGASRKAALASLYFLAVPLPTGRETWQCTRCGARWEDVGEPGSAAS